ncbi:hypothetical protein UFOVP660_26 [uncultured Caudovirales phage]|uniref:Uncharacterized protein n=1 Tax=uncultured Caudovirales phage TaxID=2100421 RepID=A0A6J5NB22_9CAUD|nr:hypothetical protein UFOVP660_26 [uncultured Caudovirales phage]
MYQLSDFDKDLRTGQLAEDELESLFREKGRIEVKTDFQWQRTGNVYIEHTQWTRSGGWKPSGISITKADYWAFVLPKGQNTPIIKLYPLKLLKAICPSLKDIEMNIQPNPTKGYLLPLPDSAIEIALGL